MHRCDSRDVAQKTKVIVSIRGRFSPCRDAHMMLFTVHPLGSALTAPHQLGARWFNKKNPAAISW